MCLKDLYLSHWDKIFWIFFLILGILFTVASFIRFIYLDIFLGVLIMAMGLEKLSEELIRKRHSEHEKRYAEQLREMKEQIDQSIRKAQSIYEKSDLRFHNAESKRSEIEQKIEDNYDSLAKKIIQLENKMNEISRFLVAEFRERKK